MSAHDVRRYIVLSTSHVSEETARRLDNIPAGDWPCLGGPYGQYGWFLYAHDENAGIGKDEIPADLFTVMTWTRKQGYDYLLLDCDGDEVEELPRFDW
ncbi:hypothetical protein MIC97_20650 [Aquamicrobium sp. NLF2-7]|uniref:DUF5983 family protein n=1 Tax=Aquamicrobium sp. NLF2-7 TaxID=2918753 RepID=UPI001EFAD396|nr:hypothetical protein [Aquamicrobium sp. NLF2-7]MCG8273898.1 hypothetical protein [Aquamicrobium sp. NLF2-7]